MGRTRAKVKGANPNVLKEVISNCTSPKIYMANSFGNRQFLPNSSKYLYKKDLSNMRPPKMNSVKPSNMSKYRLFISTLKKQSRVPRSPSSLIISLSSAS